MTPIRYPYLLLFLCLLAGARTAQAQCSASAVATNVHCFGQSNGSIDLTASNGTAPYTYAWSNSQTTEDLSGLAVGTYTCTVTDALSCTSTVSATVSQPAQILVTIADVTLNCFTPSGTLEASVTGGVPPYQYLWSNGETTNPPQIQLPGIYGLTVTDANGCTASSSAYVLVDANAPIACIGPNQILTCTLTQVVLDGSCSSIGPNFTVLWSGPGITPANESSLSPSVSFPGTYTITVINTANGCTSTDNVTVIQDANFPTISLPSELSIPCGSDAITLPGISQGPPIITYTWTTQDGNILSGGNTPTPEVNAPGTYILLVTSTGNGCTTTASVTVTGGGTLCSTILGRVLQDTMENCLTDAGEPPISGWIVKAQATLGTYYALTDANGDYQISVQTGGDYAISAIAKSTLWEACPAIPNVLAANTNETYTANDLLFQKLAGCPLLTVDISSGNLRRCFDTNHFSVSYCNNGTATAENAYVDVTLDPLFTPLSSTLPYTDQGGGVLRFLLGNIDVWECGSFSITAHLSCDAVLGQTHCTEAHIYPDIPCIPTDPLWSGASLQISSQCQSDSLRFTIKNVGIGNMANTVEYVVVEDQVMLMTAPLQLNAGQEVTVSVPANGSTWRLEVEQVPYHPGHSAPAVSVEGCTTSSSFSKGFVTMFPADDADEFVDIDCRQNTASSDPNDKQAFPKGYGAAHYIRPGTPLEYQIQFQNTGNDTAFTVRVLDTLSSWLDPSTIRPGASTHPYSWDLGGAGVLSFLFQHILLPDSNVNEPASHGFVKFTVNPRADAPLETVIENTAEIYFDFNDAIVTNTTFHRLGENFITVGLWQPQQLGYEVLVSPNPFSDAAWLEVKGLRQNSPLHLQVFDLQGKLQMEMDSDGSVFELKKRGLPGGVYFFKIEQNRVSVGTGRLIVQD